MLVDLVCVLHDRRKTPHDLLPYRIAALSTLLQQRRNGMATHAAQTNPAAIKPYKVVSASVGPLPPIKKNIPFEAPDPRLRLDAVNSAFTFSQISVLSIVISSGVKRPVPWP